MDNLIELPKGSGGTGVIVHVALSSDAANQLIGVFDAAKPDEFMALGQVEAADGTLYIHSLWFPAQDVSGAHVELKEEEFADAAAQLKPEVRKAYNCWIHSHPMVATLGPSPWSNEDNTQIRRMLDSGYPYVVSVLLGRKAFVAKVSFPTGVEITGLPVHVALNNAQIREKAVETWKEAATRQAPLVVGSIVDTSSTHESPTVERLAQPKTTLFGTHYGAKQPAKPAHSAPDGELTPSEVDLLIEFKATPIAELECSDGAGCSKTCPFTPICNPTWQKFDYRWVLGVHSTRQRNEIVTDLARRFQRRQAAAPKNAELLLQAFRKTPLRKFACNRQITTVDKTGKKRTTYAGCDLKSCKFAQICIRVGDAITWPSDRIVTRPFQEKVAKVFAALTKRLPAELLKERT